MFSTHERRSTTSWDDDEARDVFIACAWVAAIGFGMVLAVILGAAA